MTRPSLDLLFHPSSVAVIGASADPNNLGHRIVRNLVETGFAGAIYPVHPRGGEILGLPVSQSVGALPDGIAMAVVCVPWQAVLDVVDQCASAKAGAIIVISAGFAETGDNGVQLQQLLAEKAADHDMRVVGPNCVGVINTDPAVRMNTTFCHVPMSHGTVALGAHSGALGVLALAKGEQFNIGFSQFASVGNESDVSVVDLLEHWGDHDETEVILLYLESIPRAAQFREAAFRVGREKPVVAIKAGRAEAGRRAACSHTAALTSSEHAVDAFFQQTGIIRAETLDEMLELAAMFEHQPLPSGRRVGIVTNAGGPGVLCADACERVGLDVPVISPELQDQLAQIAPPPASPANPVDILASARPAEYCQATASLLASGEVDAVVVIYVPVEMVANAEFVEAICDGVELARKRTSTNRPVVACIMSKSDERSRLATPTETIPCCTAPAAAAAMLGKAAAYAEWQREPRGTLPRFEDIDLERAREIIAAAERSAHDGWLSAALVSDFAEAVGLPMLDGTIALTSSEAAESARRLGFPVALKTASAHILHKTDIGAIELNLRSEEEVRAAFDLLVERVATQSEAAADAGVLVQPMCSGIELLIGATRDPQLGPLLTFGLGGTYVEIVRDVCHRLPPLTDREANDMVRSIRAYPLLVGYRGQPPADIPAIEQLLLRVSTLLVELPEVCELDLNHVAALPPTQGCRIVDARIRVRF